MEKNNTVNVTDRNGHFRSNVKKNKESKEHMDSKFQIQLKMTEMTGMKIKHQRLVPYVPLGVTRQSSYILKVLYS